MKASSERASESQEGGWRRTHLSLRNLDLEVVVAILELGLDGVLAVEVVDMWAWFGGGELVVLLGEGVIAGEGLLGGPSS